MQQFCTAVKIQEPLRPDLFVGLLLWGQSWVTSPTLMAARYPRPTEVSRRAIMPRVQVSCNTEWNLTVSISLVRVTADHFGFRKLNAINKSSGVLDQLHRAHPGDPKASTRPQQPSHMDR